jgi:hypothetical protein
MGRFVNSRSPEVNYEYKFAFAEQSSNFGEVLEQCSIDEMGVTRYCSDIGEYVDVYIDNAKKVKEGLLVFLSEENDKNNQRMLKQLVNAIPDSLEDCTDLQFYVEY